jgi:hypothetical protein
MEKRVMFAEPYEDSKHEDTGIIIKRSHIDPAIPSIQGVGGIIVQSDIQHSLANLEEEDRKD